MTREELNKAIQEELSQEDHERRKKKILKGIVIALFFMILFFFFFFLYTTYISTTTLEVREYRIQDSKIPESFGGIKIIQMSDLHYGSTMYLKEVKKIVKLSNERKPDIVVFTGDLLYPSYELTSKEQEKLIQELQKIDASMGKYAILGDEDTEKVSTIFNQSNFTLLRNEYDLVYSEENQPILLIGLSSMKKEQNITQGYQYFQEEIHLADIYTITLLHEPDAVDEILPTHPTDLFLAGHSHNGNIRLPFSGYSIFKKENATHYYKEFYDLTDSKLYISSGLGTEKGIRLFCRPSINFYRLSSK